MPLLVPTVDNRKYADLLADALARIPAHTPEWTNFNESDPGITLVELFAFLTENLLYRANFIPERNRLKFLSLLGMSLQSGSSARGLVSFRNERGPLETITLNSDLEARAGAVPYRTEMGVDVLPVEARVYYKSAVADPQQQTVNHYTQLYASYLGAQPVSTTQPQLYETVSFETVEEEGLALSQTIDGALWIALLARESDADRIDDARKAIAGHTLSIGIVPIPPEPGRDLVPSGATPGDPLKLLQFQIPQPPPGGSLPQTPSQRVPQYKTLPAFPDTDVLSEPGIVQVTLPAATELILWNNLDPLEAGVGNFPPGFDDTALQDRLITWVRISSSAPVESNFLSVTINATIVTQRAHVANERLPDGMGTPDQVIKLAKTPVIASSLKLTVTPPNGTPRVWEAVDDLYSAGAEVPVSASRLPPGSRVVSELPVYAYRLYPESGEIRFGDGAHGARPPDGASIRADYDYGVGRAGNVGAGSVNTSPALPAGIKVSNPVSTWGGADPETIADGEKRIAGTLQHRDRLVSADDFQKITRSTPGVDVGRVEVLPAFNPAMGQSEPGGAPGAVTLMVIPKYDSAHPNAPEPDRLFLDAICAYLDPRRLVTTEVFLRGPTYVDIWVSVGVEVIRGSSIAEVSEAVKATLTAFLHPLPQTDIPEGLREEDAAGWTLNRTIMRLELMAVVNRVPDVRLVGGLVLYNQDGVDQESIAIGGLQLPRVRGIAVGIGTPPPAEQVPGLMSSAPITPTGEEPTSDFVPVPLVPENC